MINEGRDMIKYWHDMSHDPEPPIGARVSTIGAWYVWQRVPCQRSRRTANRDSWPRGPRRHTRRLRRAMYGRYRGGTPGAMVARGHCRDGDHTWAGHWHWTNGDRWRPWGNFRGYSGRVMDMDAFRRMRRAYRARH